MTTSEFDTVKARLAGLQSRKDVEIVGRPTLHARGSGNKGNGPVLRRPGSTPTTSNQKDPDQPTLKRQPN